MTETKEQKRIPGYKSKNQKYKSLLATLYALVNTEESIDIKISRLERAGISVVDGRITSSGTPQQQQPRKRSYRPWGCYLRPGSPSSQRPSRQKAAFVLQRNGFCISYSNAGSMSPRNGDTNILQRNCSFVKTKREVT